MAEREVSTTWGRAAPHGHTQEVVPVAGDDDPSAEGPHPGRRIVDLDKLSEESLTVSLVHEAIQPSFDAGVSEGTRDE